ncbi:MAG TPA: hypothetical protein EYN66_14410, partial [Myxococcales bacterium]|nr:hypothetical protein [Myxococcales bacterium]
VPSVAVPSVAVPSVVVPSVTVPSVAVPSVVPPSSPGALQPEMAMISTAKMADKSVLIVSEEVFILGSETIICELHNILCVEALYGSRSLVKPKSWNRRLCVSNERLIGAGYRFVSGAFESFE